MLALVVVRSPQSKNKQEGPRFEAAERHAQLRDGHVAGDCVADEFLGLGLLAGNPVQDGNLARTQQLDSQQPPLTVVVREGAAVREFLRLGYLTVANPEVNRQRLPRLPVGTDAQAEVEPLHFSPPSTDPAGPTDYRNDSEPVL